MRRFVDWFWPGLGAFFGGVAFILCVGAGVMLSGPAHADVPKSAVHVCNGLGGACYGALAANSATWIYICEGSPYEASGRCIGILAADYPGGPADAFGCGSDPFGARGVGTWGYCGVGSMADPALAPPPVDPPASSASSAGMSYSTQVGAYVLVVGCVLCVGLGLIAGQQR